MGSSTHQMELTQPECGNSGELYTRKDIEQLFAEVVDIYRKHLAYDLSYMKVIVTDKPALTQDGKPADMLFDEKTCGGVHTWLGFDTFNINYRAVMKYHGFEITPEKEKEFIILIHAHELGHEVYQKHMSDDVIRSTLFTIRKGKFSTPYTRMVEPYVKERRMSELKYYEEQVAEYLASLVVRIFTDNNKKDR